MDDLAIMASCCVPASASVSGSGARLNDSAAGLVGRVFSKLLLAVIDDGAGVGRFDLRVAEIDEIS